MYEPIGYINCIKIIGGFNNQLEQIWFLNILAQRTNRGLVEKPIKLIDQEGGPKVNISEVVNRSKYFNNLPTIQESDFLSQCGPYTKRIDLPLRNWLIEDEFQFMIDLINNTPQYICINLEFFPTYEFFATKSFINWMPSFKELVLPNFEFSTIIKQQADYFIKENGLEDNDFISVQFRRGDYIDHCKTLYNQKYENWAFSYLYNDKFTYDKTNWKEFELHCYPSISRLTEEVSKFNNNLTKKVKKVLLMTNADSSEILDLKTLLSDNELTTLRFEPNQELIPSTMNWTITHSLAVEMELGLRGDYLIGNRHSSIFSNLLALRSNSKSEFSNLIV